MKEKLFVGFIVSALFLTKAAHADFTFYSSTDDCTNVSGAWVGSGTASNWLIECAYNGSGTISRMGSDEHFTLEVIADKRSGSGLCPQHPMLTLSGACEHGEVIVKTEYGNLTGVFSKDTGTSNGTLSIVPGIDLTVAIQFHRQ